MNMINIQEYVNCNYKIGKKSEADCLIENGHQVKQWDAIKLWISNYCIILGWASKDGIPKVIGEINFPHLK